MSKKAARCKESLGDSYHIQNTDSLISNLDDTFPESLPGQCSRTIDSFTIIVRPP